MSNRELVQQLNGALMNSMGKDFEIRADFVLEIIAALSARSETATIAEGATPVDVLCAQLEFVCSPIHTIHEERKETCDRVTTKLRTLERELADANAGRASEMDAHLLTIADHRRELAAHGRIEDQLETGAEALKADIAELRAKLAKRDRLIDAQHTTQGVLHAENVKQRERAESAERKLSAEYICKCGIRVTPHRCATGEDF